MTTSNRPLRELLDEHARRYALREPLALVRHDVREPGATTTVYRRGDRELMVREVRR